MVLKIDKIQLFKCTDYSALQSGPVFIFIVFWWQKITKLSSLTYQRTCKLVEFKNRQVWVRLVEGPVHPCRNEVYLSTYSFGRLINGDAVFSSVLQNRDACKFSGNCLNSGLHEVQIPILLFIFSPFWRLLAQIYTLFFWLFGLFSFRLAYMPTGAKSSCERFYFILTQDFQVMFWRIFSFGLNFMKWEAKSSAKSFV